MSITQRSGSTASRFTTINGLVADKSFLSLAEAQQFEKEQHAKLTLGLVVTGEPASKAGWATKTFMGDQLITSPSGGNRRSLSSPQEAGPSRRWSAFRTRYAAGMAGARTGVERGAVQPIGFPSTHWT